MANMKTKRLTAKEVYALANKLREERRGSVAVNIRGLVLAYVNSSVQWIFRSRKKGFEFKKTLGEYQLRDRPGGLTLKQAENVALDYLDQMSKGIHPINEQKRIREEQAAAEAERRREEQSVKNTVAAVFEDYKRDARKKRIKNYEAYIQQRQGYFDNHINKVIGSIPISAISPDEVVEVIAAEPLRSRKADTKKKILALISELFTHAQVKKQIPRNLANPVKGNDLLRILMEHEGVSLKNDEERHHGALSSEDAQEFTRVLLERIRTNEINGHSAMSSKALLFAILTNLRAANVTTGKKNDSTFISPRWSRIDRHSKTMRIPADEMKTVANGEHIVYLSSFTLMLLDSIPQREGVDMIFISSQRSPFSASAMAQIIRRINEGRRAAGQEEFYDRAQSEILGRRINATQHGISRATFKTWAETELNRPNHRLQTMAIELNLDHVAVKGEVEKAYLRDNIEKIKDERRFITEAWAQFLLNGIDPEPYLFPNGRVKH